MVIVYNGYKNQIVYLCDFYYNLSCILPYFCDPVNVKYILLFILDPLVKKKLLVSKFLNILFSKF